MTGKYSITIDSDDFIQGLTTSSNLVDGGFSPETDCVNLLANPGVIYAPNTPTTVGSLSGNIAASCYDPHSSSSDATIDRWIITDNAVLYTLSGSTLTSKGTVTAVSSNVVSGISDIQVYNNGSATGQIFITGTNGVAIVSYSYSSGTPSIPGSTSFSLTNNPHPMLIYNKLLYIADGYQLHTYDGSSFSTGVLQIQSDQCITALNIDPGSGNMMVGVSSRDYLTSIVGQDGTVARNSPAFIGLYDGVNPTQFQRKVPVDNTVTAFYNCGQVTYVIYGSCLGYWTGAGIQFLRRIINPLQRATYLNLYKNKITGIDNMVYFVESYMATQTFLSNSTVQIVGYGEIQRGTPAFFPLINKNGSAFITGVFNLGNNALAYAYSGTLYSIVIQPASAVLGGVLSTGDNSPIWVSKVYSLPRPCTINQVRVFYQDTVTPGSTSIGNLAVIDDNLGVVYNTDISNPSTGKSKNNFDIFPNIISTEFKLKYQWKETSTNHGIQKFMVFYTPIE